MGNTLAVVGIKKVLHFLSTEKMKEALAWIVWRAKKLCVGTKRTRSETNSESFFWPKPNLSKTWGRRRVDFETTSSSSRENVASGGRADWSWTSTGRSSCCGSASSLLDRSTFKNLNGEKQSTMSYERFLSSTKLFFSNLESSAAAMCCVLIFWCNVAKNPK